MHNGSVGTVETRIFSFDKLRLVGGKSIAPITVAYETYGELDEERANAILILHALSGDAHAAGFHNGVTKPGWWDAMIGPGKAFDTDKYYVICSNILGGCKGSTGPSSPNPATGQPYGLSFPIITIPDMVEVQRHLIDHLNIERLLSVAGGSMGGMQALQWVASYPDRLRSCIPIAATVKHSPMQIAFNEVGRQAVMADPNWNNGDYYDGNRPERGLAVARMVGHITYMSDDSMQAKFARNLKNGALNFDFVEDFEVEGYLRYQGDSFVQRFDANSYLYITKALDYFDVSGDLLIPPGQEVDVRFLIIAFKSDWLYPPHQSKTIVRQLKLHHCNVTYCEIDSNYGHDAFLVEMDEQQQLITHFLERTYRGKPLAPVTYSI